jgi:signal transduction histidine kinase
VVFGYGAAGGGPWLCAVLAAYGVGAYANARRAAVGIAVIVGAVVLASVPKFRAGEGLAELATPAGALVIVWVAGRVGARRRARADVVERRAAELEARSQQIARQAAERERARIARELHDAVTHEMTVMVVQAQAAQSLSEVEPERAREAMRAVEESGRSALVEMRRLLGVIRGEATAERAPQPGLAEVESLIARVRDAGLPVTYSVEGHPGRVPVTLGVCAYRILQESLSNVVRHAGSAATQVRIRVAADDLRVEVQNGPGTAMADPLASGGAGLAGMRERVAVFGGDLSAGERAGGGYAVAAVLPLHAR